MLETIICSVLHRYYQHAVHLQKHNPQWKNLFANSHMSLTVYGVNSYPCLYSEGVGKLPDADTRASEFYVFMMQ